MSYLRKERKRKLRKEPSSVRENSFLEFFRCIGDSELDNPWGPRPEVSGFVLEPRLHKVQPVLRTWDHKPCEVEVAMGDDEFTEKRWGRTTLLGI